MCSVPKCNKPSALIAILADDRTWSAPLGLCNNHKGTECFREGMSEEGHTYLTLEEFQAVGDLHGS